MNENFEIYLIIWSIIGRPLIGINAFGQNRETVWLFILNLLLAILLSSFLFVLDTLLNNTSQY